MSVLGKFLQAKDPLFTLAIKQLEDHTGNKGIDTKLIGELLAKSHAAMRTLKLDPADTKGVELYNSLLNLVKEHNQLLMTGLGGKDPDDTQEVIKLLLKKYNELDIPKSGWFLSIRLAIAGFKNQQLF